MKAAISLRAGRARPDGAIDPTRNTEQVSDRGVQSGGKVQRDVSAPVAQERPGQTTGRVFFVPAELRASGART